MALFFWLALLVPFTSAHADIDFHRTLADWDRQCASYAPDTPDPLSFEDVRQFVTTHRVTSVQGFVAAMGTDQKFMPFLKSYVLMHHSRSMQRYSVDPEHPRVIFFHKGLVLAVVDNPSKPNPTVEVVQYTPAKHQFEFNEIDFSEPRHPFHANPTSCTECHGNPKVPIWNSYRTWPGAYNIAGEWFWLPNPDLEKYTHAQLREKRRRLWHLQEQMMDEDFVGPPDLRSFDELNKLFSPVARDRKGVYAYLEEARTGDDSAALTRFLTDLNYDRVIHEMSSIRNPERFRYAQLGALLRCRNLEDFAGPQTRAQLDQAWRGESVASLHDDVHSEMARQFQGLLTYAKRIGDENAMHETAMNDEDDAIRFAGLRYFYEPQGVNVKRFSLNYTPGRDVGYGLSIIGAGGGGWRFAFCRFIPQAVRADAALAPLLALEPVSTESVDEVEKYFCPLLREKSRQLLK